MPIVSANDIDFYCEFTGPADAPVVVFINALGATVEMWREQVEALSAGYRCLTFDANGHGRSSAQAMRPAIQSLANDLARIARRSRGQPSHHRRSIDRWHDRAVFCRQISRAS